MPSMQRAGGRKTGLLAKEPGKQLTWSTATPFASMYCLERRSHIIPAYAQQGVPNRRVCTAACD